MSPITHFHPAAEEELAAALDWYEARSARAANRFLQEITATLERIGRAPTQFPLAMFQTRRATLHHFPYAVLFQVQDEAVQIFAVAHAKRRPGYWRERASKS